MNTQLSSTRSLTLSLAVAGALTIGLAPVAARADDPGIARISSVQSDVAIKHGDSGVTVAAAVNAPVMAGDYLTTGDDSRAEIQFDNADMVRVGGDAQLRFTQLGASGDTTQLAAGTVEMRVFQSSAPLEIETPSITVRPSGASAIRVTVDDSGTTLVTVRQGEASIVTPQGTQSLSTGSSLQASGASANPQIQTTEAIATDDFDSWNDQRDHIVASASNENQYLNQGVVGSADLGQDGTWQQDPTYGNVWIPANTAPGWAPYQDGQWAWEGYYGWTWVSYEPWGWAPYHYGRWFYAENRWAWYPGPRYARPQWQPALVGFFGFGGVGVGFENIGWVPLAPHETYHAWYGARGNSRANTSNVSINNFRNGRAPGAISGISSSAWSSGNFQHRMTLSPGDARNVTAWHGALPITPTRQDQGFTRQPIDGTYLPRARTAAFTGFGSRSFANPASFEQQRSQVQSRDFTSRPDAWSRFNSVQGNSYRSNEYRGNYSGNAGRSYSNGTYGNRGYRGGSYSNRSYSSGGNRGYSSGGNRGGNRGYGSGGNRGGGRFR